MSGGALSTMKICGYTFDDIECMGEGDHFCTPRANKAQAFFEEILVHTKGQYVRKKFILAPWQRDDIIRPLFGQVIWSDDFNCYKRRYEIAWIEMARKDLAVETPLLTANRGWITMADVQVGDLVYNLEGQAEAVDFVSDVFAGPCHRVSTRFGKSLVTGADHDWLVMDRTKPRGMLRQSDGTRLKGEYAKYIMTTAELAAETLQDKKGLYRYALPRAASLKMDSPALLVDPYCLGAWLGDGTSASGAMTAHEDDQPFMREQFESAGYATKTTSVAQVFYVRKLMTDLRALGVLNNKHVPEQYLLASEEDRLQLLRGLMDTDGWAGAKGNALVYGFCSKTVQLADSVEFLARSLGYNTSRNTKRVLLPGTDRYGDYVEIRFSAVPGLSNPHRMPRKAEKSRASSYRAQDDGIVSVELVGDGMTRCLGIPSGVFLAGRDLMPTANCGKTELLAGIMLYLLAADGEESGEIYGVARDITQASLAFDVAKQMVIFSPTLSKHLTISEYKKRIYQKKTNSFYQVIAADAKSALGTNPSGVGADEILAWQSGEMWSSMRTGMGSGARREPLMVAATTAGNDPEGFAGQMHKKMEQYAENPDNPDNKHVFVYMRNTPETADPWDEKNWPIANPALGDFLTWEGMRKQAAEAKNNPIEEMAFRQYRLNQWQSSTVRWMNMFLWDKPANKAQKYPNFQAAMEAFTGYECWFGLDLASRQDLCSICYLFPSADPTYGVDLIWRHYMPSAAVKKLDRLNKGRFTKEFVKNGWLKVTEGNVLDYNVMLDDMEADANRFIILGGDADWFASDKVIQDIRQRTYLGQDDIFSYQNTYDTLSPGMTQIFEMVTEGLFRHHDNPLARFCFDACEAKLKPDDPDKIMPVKPNRMTAEKRIDAVPAAIMAMNAYRTRDNQNISLYASEDILML